MRAGKDGSAGGNGNGSNKGVILPAISTAPLGLVHGSLIDTNFDNPTVGVTVSTSPLDVGDLNEFMGLLSLTTLALRRGYEVNNALEHSIPSKLFYIPTICRAFLAQVITFRTLCTYGVVCGWVGDWGKMTSTPRREASF